MLLISNRPRADLEVLARLLPELYSTQSYLNNRVFLSRNYRAVAPGNLMFLYASFKNIRFPRGNYQTIVPLDINTLLSLLFTSNFSSARQLKNHVELFSTLLDESRVSQCKI